MRRPWWWPMPGIHSSVTWHPERIIRSSSTTSSSCVSGNSTSRTYDPRFASECHTLSVISRYTNNVPQLLHVIEDFRLPDGRAAEMWIQRLGLGKSLADSLSVTRIQGWSTLRNTRDRFLPLDSYQGLILDAYARIHTQLRSVPKGSLVDRPTPPGVEPGDTGGFFGFMVDWYAEFYRRNYEKFGSLIVGSRTFSVHGNRDDPALGLCFSRCHSAASE